MKFRLVLVSLALAALPAVFACGDDDDSGISSDPCPTTDLQPCDDDIAITQAQHDACETSAASSCGTSFKAYQLCENENLKCTSARVTDTAAQAAACATQAAAYQACTNGTVADSGS